MSRSGRGQITDALFVLLAATAALAAQVWSDSEVVSGLLLNLSVVFLSIVVLSRLWVRLGGDPMSRQLDDMAAQVEVLRTEMNGLAEILTVTRDASAAGLAGLSARSNDHMTAAEWRSRLLHAQKRVDLSGTAQHGWMSDTTFFEATVVEGVRRGCRYRVMLYAPLLPGSPDAHPIRQLMEDERDRSFAMASHNRDALRFYLELSDRVPLASSSGSFELRVVDRKVQYDVISRFDDQLLIVQYLYHARSESTPTFEVRGAETPLFKTYTTEFEALWLERARPLSDDERAYLLDGPSTGSNQTL